MQCPLTRDCWEHIIYVAIYEIKSKILFRTLILLCNTTSILALSQCPQAQYIIEIAEAKRRKLPVRIWNNILKNVICDFQTILFWNIARTNHRINQICHQNLNKMRDRFMCKISKNNLVHYRDYKQIINQTISQTISLLQKKDFKLLWIYIEDTQELLLSSKICAYVLNTAYNAILKESQDLKIKQFMEELPLYYNMDY
jgi:hypothetical protein